MPDLLTVTAIALVAYAASNVVHEAVGHGGACLAFGGKPLVLSSEHFECGEDGIGTVARRGVSAAGTVANFIAGTFALAAFKITNPRQNPHIAYFLWLLATLNVLMGAGYFLFSGVAGIGDWAVVAQNTMSSFIWRPAMAIFGGALYFRLARQSAQYLRSLVGTDELQMRRSKVLTIPAYVAGGALYCLSGVFNPQGPILIAMSAAAASFGGTSGLLWLTRFVDQSRGSVESVEVDRSYLWILAGCLVSFIFIAILGPGVHF